MPIPKDKRMEAKSITVQLPDGHRKNEPPLEVQIDIYPYMIDIHLKGYGTFDVEGGAPICLELWDGRPQLIVFDDIQIQEPKIIDLSRALESLFERSE